MKQKSLATDTKRKKRRILIECLIGGAAVVGLAVGLSVGLTQCKKPVDDPGLIINNSIASDFFVNDGIDIYVNSLSAGNITNHNRLLDLQEYAASQSYTGDVFTISGTIDFGLLAGFDQNVTLKGASNSLVEITGWTVASYGIIVGSKTQPAAGSDSYTGSMDIQSSTTFTVSSSSTAYGVYFGSTAAGSTAINGTFTVSSSSYVYGVFFAGTAADSTQTINGTFTLSSTYEAVNGVFFYNTTAGSTQTINGTFTVSASSSYVYGVRFAGSTGGSATINGTFTVSSTASIAFGVYFTDGTAAGSTQTINGTFTVSSTASNAFGVYYTDGTAAGSTRTINGTFTLSSSSSAYGVFFVGTVTGSAGGIPTFYSNQTDSGSWTTIGNTENWNGSSGTTTADATLTVGWIYDTENDADYNYRILVITAAKTSPDNKAAFNTVYRQSLRTYVNTLPDSSVGKGWIEHILDQEW